MTVLQLLLFRLIKGELTEGKITPRIRQITPQLMTRNWSQKLSMVFYSAAHGLHKNKILLTWLEIA